MITAPLRPLKPGTKVSQKQAASWRSSITQQIADEPFELLKKAGEQMVGVQPASDGLKSPDDTRTPQESALEKKRHTVLAALRQELAEIDELAKKRQEEMRAGWRDQEELKKQREEEAKKSKKPLLEPVAKIKRGILGGMQKIGLRRKQRQVELAKTPSN